VLRIDHVILGTRDLDATAERLYRELGLASVPGGRHPGWGTGNRIVPLGDSYVEILGVMDEREAAANPLGSRFLEGIDGTDRLIAWCLAPDNLDAVATRLGLDIADGSRERPDGVTLRWRSAGLEEDGAEELPFFIEWMVPPHLHPGRATPDRPHRVAPQGVSWVEVSGDGERLRALLDGQGGLARIAPGPGGVQAAGIATAEGEIVLR
jgi:hypothetical protein